MSDGQLAGFLAASAWYRNLGSRHARRVKDAVRVKDFASGAYVCHKGQRIVEVACGRITVLDRERLSRFGD